MTSKRKVNGNTLRKQQRDRLKPEVRKQLREERKRQRDANPAHAEQRRKSLSESMKRKAAEHEAERVENMAMVEQARRILCRDHLLPFVMRFQPQYMPGWVHKDICQRLEQFSQDVADKKSPRLMLFMPPRHGKSELASKNFPAWHLGRHPEHEIIACSYAGSLAMSFSRKVRALVRDQGYRGVFKKTELDPDNQSAESWMTTQGGGYVAAGVGGGITGKGAHILIIDDPVKNAEDAESETARQAQKDWYTSTAYTRLAPGGGVLVIQTRWHDDDLSGWLLRMQEEHPGEADEWEVVEYPAEALQDETFRKKGDALHPDRYDERALKRIRGAVGERVWWALYQQRPVADEGEYFKREWFRYYVQQPKRVKTYVAWDLAVTKKERSDYTVGVVVGVDEDENIYLLHMERGKWDGEEIVEKILDVYERWKPEITGIEAGQIQAAIGPFLEKRIAERKLYSFYYKELPPKNRDKESRARAIQGRMQQGKVYFPDKATITHELEAEMLRFPNGVHDDMVDAMAWIGRMLLDMVGAVAPKKAKRKGWRDRLRSLHKAKASAGAMAA